MSYDHETSAAARRFTPCIWSWAARWCRSPAMTCRCNIRPGILKEHLHTREQAGLFDVSHMGQAFLGGDDPAARAGKAHARRCHRPEGGMQRYGLLLNHQGTIKDDFMFSRLAGEARALSGGQCRAPRTATSPISPTKLEGRCHPDAAPRPRACWRCKGRRRRRCWSATAPASRAHLHAGRCAPMWRARPPSSAAPAIPAKTVLRFRWKALTPNVSPARLLAEPECCPSGLARATACGWKRGSAFTAMTWTRPSIRWKPIWSGPSASAARPKADFAGAESMLDKLLNGAGKKRVGILPEGRAPAREGTEIATIRQGDRHGHLRRLRPQPERPVAMGYVRKRIRRRPAPTGFDGAGQGPAGHGGAHAFRASTATNAEIRGAGDERDTFHRQHEWVRLEGDSATIGITKYAAEELGDVVFVELPPRAARSAPAPKPRWWKASRPPAKSMPRWAAKSARPMPRWKPSPPRSMTTPKAQAGSSSSRSCDRRFRQADGRRAYAEFVKGL